VKPTFFKTKAHLMICTGQSCSEAGSRFLFRSVWQSFETEKLVYYKSGGNLRLTESGCLGSCQFAPSAACYFKSDDGNLGQAWYAKLDHPQVMNIARALYADLELPERNRYDSSRDDSGRDD
jgi:(2Fe-2S) ferredoxin